jgi:hypothetical protein
MRLHCFLIVLCLLVCEGCAYNLAPERMFYPTSWPPLRVSARTDCADFAGIYEALGENAQPSPNSVNGPTLLSVLGMPGSRETAYVSVQSTQNPGAWLAIPLNSAQEPIPSGGSSDRLACSGGNLVRNFARAGYADGANHKGETSVTLSLTASGSLVAHVVGTSQTYGLFSIATRAYDVLYKFRRSR